MPWKVLITASGLAKAGREANSLLLQAGCELVVPKKFGPLPANELEPLLRGADAAIASLDAFTASVLNSDNSSNLKIIARWGAGFDSVDLVAATQQGIVVTTTPGLMDEPVAEYTFALLLALARRVPGIQQPEASEPNIDAAASPLEYQPRTWQPAWGYDLAGKTLGIIGLGRIGKAVARRASVFSMNLVACDPKPITLPGVRSVTLDTLLAESDFISLHAALTDMNRGMIGEPQFRRMKPTAFLINTARGGLVDEPALAHALASGRLAGAALDVFATEPLPASSPLRSAPNLLISPHQAGFTYETGEKVSLAAARAVVDLMQGTRPVHVINPAIFNSEALRAKLTNT